MSEPLDLVVQELRQVASSLRREDTQHGHLSGVADALAAHADTLAEQRDPAGFHAVAAELKKIAKALNPDDATAARHVAEACLRLLKLAPEEPS